MNLTSFIPRKGIDAALKGTDRKAVIQELVALLKKAHPTQKFNVQEVAAAVLQRELKIGSTGVGDGVAIPHARVESLKQVIGVFGRTTKGIAFNAVDGEPVSLFFLIVAPASKAAEYGQALERIARSVKRPNFCKFLHAAKTAKAIGEIFEDVEAPAAV